VWGCQSADVRARAAGRVDTSHDIGRVDHLHDNFPAVHHDVVGGAGDDVVCAVVDVDDLFSASHHDHIGAGAHDYDSDDVHHDDNLDADDVDDNDVHYDDNLDADDIDDDNDVDDNDRGGDRHDHRNGEGRNRRAVAWCAGPSPGRVRVREVRAHGQSRPLYRLRPGPRCLHGDSGIDGEDGDVDELSAGDGQFPIAAGSGFDAGLSSMNLVNS